MSNIKNMNLFNYLISKNYTEDEALETILRAKWNLQIPEEIKKDITEYLNKKFKRENKKEADELPFN